MKFGESGIQKRQNKNQQTFIQFSSVMINQMFLYRVQIKDFFFPISKNKVNRILFIFHKVLKNESARKKLVKRRGWRVKTQKNIS